MTKIYDASKEHQPFDRTEKTRGRHPNKKVKDGKHPITGNRYKGD